MTESDRVFDAFRNCITEPKCRDCPWTECDKLKNRVVEIPIDLALAVMRMLIAYEPVAPIQDADDKEDDIFRCGACGAVVGETFLGPPGEIEVRHNFCQNCGQAVKWE